MHFVLPIVPTAQQRPRFSRWGTHKSKRQELNEAELDSYLKQYVPDSPLCGPVSVEFTAFMPIPESTTKKARADFLQAKTPHAKRPDIDNLEKQIFDRMTALKFWRDDSLVWRVVKEKVYSDRPRWEVRVEEWGARLGR